MSDNHGSDWLSRVSEGGLPKILLGPAGAAISRLIGASVEIPAAWLDSHSQKIRDKTDARSQLSKALAKNAVEAVGQDPELVDRAVASLLGKEYRQQVNREAVAQVAVESLKDNPPSENGAGPSDQFITNFEDYAGKASSEELRAIFGKLLADEVRSPGAVSPSTLHFVSMLDKNIAELINRALPHCWSDVALLECFNPRLNVAEISYLEQAGFWSAEKTLTLSFNEYGNIVKVVREKVGIVLTGQPGASLALDVALLSKAGCELLNAVATPFDMQALIDAASSKGVDRLFSGPPAFLGDEVRVPLEREYRASAVSA